MVTKITNGSWEDLSRVRAEVQYSWCFTIQLSPLVKATIQATTKDRYPERRNPLQRPSIAVTRVTARVFHSPVLFGLLFLVSLAAVLIAPDHQDKEG